MSKQLKEIIIAIVLVAVINTGFIYGMLELRETIGSGQENCQEKEVESPTDNIDEMLEEIQKLESSINDYKKYE